MTMDQGRHGPRTARALVRVLVAVALLGLGSVVSMPAVSAEAGDGKPAADWPASWSEYTHVGGTPVADVDGDVSPSSLDLASGACSTCTGPAGSVAWGSDGSNAFFRVRLATDITDTDAPDVPAGGFLVQIADKTGEVKAVVGVDGTDSHRTVYVSDPTADVVTEIHRSALDARSAAPSGVRVVAAPDGSGQYFLDFQVPLGAIATVSGGAVTDSTPVRLYYGSSAAADLTTDGPAAITADFMLGDIVAVDFSTLATVELAGQQHQVVFDSAGGSPVAAAAVAEGFPAAAPTTPSRPGHTFTGWFTSADGGPAYDFDAAITGPTNIHARWNRDSYLVTFDSTGGSPVADQTVAYGDTVRAPADPTRAGHTFLGWFTAATGGKAVSARSVTEPGTVYAHWRVNDTTTVLEDSAMPPVGDHAPTVTSAQPGRPSNPVVVDDRGGSTGVTDVTPPAATSNRDGHELADQSTAAEADSEADITAMERWATTLSGGSAQTTNPVEFDANGGSTVDPQTVAPGDTAAVPVQPTRVGYTFVGWFATPDGGAKWDFKTAIDEPTTLYAHWTLIGENAAEDPVADGSDAEGVDDDESGDGDGNGGRNDDETLPNTGNQIPRGLVPAAGMLLLLGFVLMTWERRKPRGAALGPA